MKCEICGEEVVLQPSASERSRRFGNPPSYYTKLFPTHSTCILKKRAEDTKALMLRNKGELCR